MHECLVCYNKIHVGVKQSECFPSHYICFTCHYQINPDKCCLCRRSTGLYDVYSSQYNKVIASYNYMPYMIEQLYAVLNLSKQKRKSIEEMITLEDYEELYVYVNGPIIKLYWNFSWIFGILSILFYILLSVNSLSPTYTIQRCYHTYHGVVCNIVGYAYVYALANGLLFCLCICSLVLFLYFMYLSIRHPKNPFKAILLQKLKN